MGLRETRIEADRLDEELARDRQRVVAGQTIAALRRGKGITYKEISWAASVSRGFVWALENGKVRNPGPAKLARIAAALDADLDVVLDLFGVLDPAITRWIRGNSAKAARLLRPHVERESSMAEYPPKRPETISPEKGP